MVLEHSDFTIKPPPPQAAAAQRPGTGFIHPNLPALPFSLAVVGPRKSGKSVVIRNLLDRKQEGSYGAAFKSSNIVFYSPTMEFDKTITSLGLKNVYGPNMSVPYLIQYVKTTQETYRAQDDMADVLVVFEDCTNTKDAWPVLTDLGYTGRHYGIHSIAVAHKLTSIPRGNRTQLQQWLLFKPHEESEREWILYMFSRLPTRRIWQAALGRAWKQQYNFVYIDFERQGMDQVYRSGFNESLFTVPEMRELEFIEQGLGPKKPDDPLPQQLPRHLRFDTDDMDDPPKEQIVYSSEDEVVDVQPTTVDSFKKHRVRPKGPKKVRGRPKGSTNKKTSQKH